MKHLLLITALALPLAVLAGCGPRRSPVAPGSIVTVVRGSESISSAKLGAKVGESTAMNILGLVAFGDASITSAARRAYITQISHVDYDTLAVLGIFESSTTLVYGE